MQTKRIVSLVPTVLLCLPSLSGAGVVVVNAMLQRPMSEWGIASSVLVATAVFLGWPMVLFAAIVSSLIGLCRGLPQRIKYANYIIVAFATIATFSLTVHFRM